MAVNKVIYGDRTLVDLTQDSVNEDNLLEGETAHDASGNPVTGTAKQGHEIENSAGTKLTQREVMQVLDGLEAVDDSTNQKTKIKMNLPIVSSADWNAMTEQERTAYKASHYRFGVEVPDTEGVINAEYMKLLWENPNTTQAFPAQTITLNSADYDFLLILYSYYTGVYKGYSLILKKDAPSAILSGVVYANNTQAGSFTRTMNKITDISYAFEDAYYQTIATGVTTTTNNSMAIPVAIYGIKKNFQFKVNAIATDLSTSADHCMLSDNVTSVEDAIDGIITQKSVINDVLTSGNTTGSFSWTASQDAVVRANGQSAQIEVNGVTVFSSNGFTGYYSFPVKSGDNVIVKGSASYTCYYDMFKR